MFEFLRTLVGRSGKRSGTPAVAASDAARGEGNFTTAQGHESLQNVDDARNAFVRREAVLDRAEKIAGYEFSLLTTLQDRGNERSGAAKRAYDAALLTRLTWQGGASLLGHRLAFISLSADSLLHPLIDKLPPQNSVLMIEASPQTTDWENIAGRLAELNGKGFFSGLKIRDAADATSPLRHQVDFIQIDVTAFDGIDLKSLVDALRKRPPDTTPPQLLARDVQSHDDFQFCEKCGFDYFQGPFLASHGDFRPAKSGINRMVVLPILRMLRSDEAYSLIADQLKNDPTLSFKLLRYLNSPALGFRQPIDNLTQALVLIGRDKFYRWMSLLLFDFEEPGYHEHSLAERALARGRTLELLAGKARIPQAPEHLFLVGLFSLLDAALGRPLPELLEEATLPDRVRDALLGSPGAYTDALALAILGEADAGTPTDQMAQALERCGISDADYAPAAAAALVWANLTLGEAG